MQLPNIDAICKFSDEIKRGELDISKFAVELHSVLDGSAHDVYKDPRLFLDKTYPTANMKNILKEALLKLARNGGQPAYVLDTEFGGGKTHTILLLYHIFRNRDLGTEYIKKIGLDKESGVLEVPDVNVVALDCTDMRKNTLWGEIAYALGRYDDVREYDEQLKSIPKEMIKRLFDKPTLLLIDELPVYLLNADSQTLGNVTLADLTIAFIQTLISAISSTKNNMLILTLTGEQRLYAKYREEVKKEIMNNVDKVRGDLIESVSRQAMFITPLNRDEVYNVIVKRLVESRDERKVNEVADAYYNYYKSKNLIPDYEYKDKIKRAYPFHPFLLDVLYERLSRSI